MTPQREAHLIRQIGACASLDELEGMRARLAHQQELVGAVYREMAARVDVLAAREGINVNRWWRRRA